MENLDWASFTKRISINSSEEQSRMNYFVRFSRGWTFYLANLKSIFEDGIDLRNRNKNLTNVINT